MQSYPLVLADQDRLELFAHLGRSRALFGDAQTWTDAAGIAWTGVKAGDFGVALTWLGPGWVFDEQAKQERAQEYQDRLQSMQQADKARHRRQGAHAVGCLHLGGHAERLLWTIHAAVLAGGTSLLCLSDLWLARNTWGVRRERWPRHWRGDLSRTLRGLFQLHVGAWPVVERPALGPATVLLTHVGDVCGTEHDVCDGHCPDAGGPRHHHFQVEVGPAFLGILESFARVGDDGVRSYRFRTGGPKSNGPALWKAGKTGKLVSVFLPAFVGDPAACATFTPRQRRLLQAMVRETVRAKVRERHSVAQPDVINGGLIRDFGGSKTVACSLLDANLPYVGFNGNRRRKGLGYLLATPNGWLSKAGYPVTEVAAFLGDLAALAAPLGLTVVGIDRASQQIGLKQMQDMEATRAGRQRLERLHVRIYTRADYLERWTVFFRGEVPEASRMDTTAPEEASVALLAELKAKRISRRALAKGVKKDHSYLNKVLNGDKPWPRDLLDKARAWVAKRPATTSAGLKRRARKPVAAAAAVVDVGVAYLGRGWSVVPQRPGAKKPCVKWKVYQDQRADAEDLVACFEKWPDAGLALVLGPVSDVFVVDVDGPEAHAALMERLGNEPRTVKALSGSRKPYRYHLFFKHPELTTQAKATPWHPNLEFRGRGGIVVIPPSMHKSGQRYEWAPGQSPDELDLFEVPPPILDALRPICKPVRNGQAGPRAVSVPSGIDASPRTLEFLSGRWAEGPRWNDRLFAAACDLCGRDMSLEEAEPLLLAGAQPWSRGEEDLARNTIQSAYSEQREPARL